MGQQRIYQVGDEPIVGYRLESFLGRGGFGEVWRATGPGGVLVALKILPDLERKHGGKELRALQLLRDIRHPNLCPVTAIWLKSPTGENLSWEHYARDVVGSAAAPKVNPAVRGTLQLLEPESAVMAPEPPPELEPGTKLIIAMGLAEKSLFDRLRECQNEGWRGIPAEELLTCLEDAARAIDLLNTRHDIQHCDIKPQNILLQSGAAQVCDFGLAKMVGEVRETSLGAGTVAYGAPEVLLGSGPASTTDQYSLAVSYVELRTGELPFASERMHDVLRAKQHGGLDLHRLPAAERQVIERATSLDPAARFESCVELVRALRGCFQGGFLQPDMPPPQNALRDTQLPRTTTSVRSHYMRRRRLRRLLNTLTTVVLLAGAAYWAYNWRQETLAVERQSLDRLAEAERELSIAEQELRLAELTVPPDSDERDVPPPIPEELDPCPVASQLAKAVAVEALISTPTPILPVRVTTEAVRIIPLESPPVAANELPAVTRSTLHGERSTETVVPTLVEQTQPRPSVRIETQRTAEGWRVRLVLADSAREVWYRLDDTGEFISTGFRDAVEAGKRVGADPKLSFMLPADTSPMTLHVQYLNRRGELQGPFAIPFSPRPAN